MNYDDLSWKVQFLVRISAPLRLVLESGDYYFCQVPCHCGAIACEFRFEEEHPVHAHRFHDCTPEGER